MPKPIYNDVRLILGDCLEKMQSLRNNSIDSIVTDPPYGIKFMSKRWDHNIPSVEIWEECLRVLKPGGFLLSFGGCRTYHRLVCNIEDAGFTIHPLIAWIFGSGFPKATNLSKMIDKSARAERGVIGKNLNHREPDTDHHERWNNAVLNPDITAPATEAAKQWDGWFYGLQALKPAIEPVCMAQKSYDGKPVESIQKWQCGALNIDGCRVEGPPSGLKPYTRSVDQRESQAANHKKVTFTDHPKGRHPANLIHDGSDKVLELFPDTKSSKSTRGVVRYGRSGGIMGNQGNVRDGRPEGHDDNGGSAARFFYCAKANKRDRNEGCEGVEGRFAPTMGNGIGGKEHDPQTATRKQNHHPTVKPTDLMRYLCRLVTPPGGLVLDPYMGSGSTGKAALKEGFKFVGIELEEEYFEIARKRVI